MTFKNTKLAQESKGLSIGLTETRTYSRTTNAFIDYDEISELIIGIDHISKADASLTPFANFEAIYCIKGNLKITVFNNSSGVNQVNVAIGSYGNGIFLKLQDLAKLRQNIALAKSVLDNLAAAANLLRPAHRPFPRLPPAETASVSMPASPPPPPPRLTSAKPKQPKLLPPPGAPQQQ